ncbi:MAG: hypothetical protein AAFP82_00965 [Bacteroidota bacterium]
MSLKDTKIYAVLSRFDKYEQNRCRKYIRSPYFNSNKNIELLYEVIINIINKPSKKKLTKELVWKKLHNDKSYDDARFRKYSSDLLKLIEGYLTQQFYEESPLIAATNMLKVVDRRKLTDLYNSTIKNSRQQSEKGKSLSADYFFQQYKIADYSFPLLDYNSKIKEKPTNYNEAMSNLDQFFFIEKLRIYSSILSREKISTHEFETDFIEDVLKYVKNNLDKVVPSVQIYYRIYLTYVEEENIKNYQCLKDLLENNTLQFPQQEAYRFYIQLINFCIKKIQSGYNDFYNEMFLIYKSMIANEVIYENGIISVSSFRNVVTVATNLKEFSWAENFIETNKTRLPIEQRENLVTFNLARVFFTQKKYSKVIELLREVEYSDISLSLQSKTFLLMTYYDTDEFEPLDFLLESFRVYINRHKEIPQKRREYFKNLIKFTKKLTKVIPGDKAAVAKIKKEIEETEGFRVKWLEEKIAELES